MEISLQVVKVALTMLIYAVYTASSSPSPVNPVCMAAHCAVQSGACFADKTCSENIGCVGKCWDKWDDDKTPDKITVQNCTNMCSFSYENKVYDNFMTCLSVHSCMSLPPIPSSCVAPQNLTLLKNIPISEMEGSWRVVRGHNPIYDCLPCQLDTIAAINSTAWIYNPSYQVHLENGTLGFINQTGIVQAVSADPKDGYSIVFTDTGFGNNETWWVFDKAEDNSYYLVYYCGNVLQWNFSGAIVFSKSDISASIVPAITESFKKATGLDFSTFCSPAITNCPN